MTKSKKLTDERKLQLATFLVYAAIALLVAPLLLYMFKFGILISSDHARWAEFGDAMSGIYAPILGVLTLLVLVRQMVMQNTLTNHQQAQDFIATNRVELDFLLLRLEKYLGVMVGGIPVTFALRKYLRVDSVKELHDAMRYETTMLIETECSNLFITWGSIYSILVGLKHNDESIYNLAFQTAKSKLSSTVGYETCCLLDNYHFVLSEGRGNAIYEFSDILSEANLAAR